MKNRIKSELARLPASLPERVTKALKYAGFGKLYSQIGNRMSNTVFVEFKHGEVRFTIEADLGNPSRTIDQKGIYEPAVTEKLAAVLGRKDCFVNVGASFGYFPLFASHITKPELVYGIEPNPETREIFKRNNHRITGGRITIEPYLVGCRNGNTETTLTVYSGLPAGEPKEVIVETREITLDKFATERNIVPDIILADIDGGEYAMLQGAENVLTEFNPKLLLEVHPEILLKNHDIRAEEVLQLLETANYSCWIADTYDTNETDWTSFTGQIPDSPFHVFSKSNAK